MEILIYLHKILIQSSFHVFPLLTVRNLLLHRLRTVHPNHAAGPFDWAETGVFEVDLSIEMYNMKIVRFVILLVFMISYYVFYSIAAYIYIYIIYHDSSPSTNFKLCLQKISKLRFYGSPNGITSPNRLNSSRVLDRSPKPARSQLLWEN